MQWNGLEFLYARFMPQLCTALAEASRTLDAAEVGILLLPLTHVSRLFQVAFLLSVVVLVNPDDSILVAGSLACLQQS